MASQLPGFALVRRAGADLDERSLATLDSYQTRLVALEDARGSAFTEVFRQQWVPGVPAMVQSNLSRTRAGGLRGLHFHRRQADYWCVLDGVALATLDSGAEAPTPPRLRG